MSKIGYQLAFLDLPEKEFLVQRNSKQIPGVSLCLRQFKFLSFETQSNSIVTFDWTELFTSSFEHMKAKTLAVATVKTRGQELFSIKSYNRITFGLKNQLFELSQTQRDTRYSKKFGNSDKTNLEFQSKFAITLAQISIKSLQPRDKPNEFKCIIEAIAIL